MHDDIAFGIEALAALLTREVSDTQDLLERTTLFRSGGAGFLPDEVLRICAHRLGSAMGLATAAARNAALLGVLASQGDVDCADQYELAAVLCDVLTSERAPADLPDSYQLHLCAVLGSLLRLAQVHSRTGAAPLVRACASPFWPTDVAVGLRRTGAEGP